MSRDLSSPKVMHTETAPTVSIFQWLLILGFPPSVAAAKAMPEIFRADENDNQSAIYPLFSTAA